MSRALHRCLACEGYTRHDDRICSGCRSRGVTHADGQVLVPITLTIPDTLLRVVNPKDHRAPLLAELEAPPWGGPVRSRPGGGYR